MPLPRSEERVLIIAPVGQDAVKMGALLGTHGVGTKICSGPAECCREVKEGAGALLLTEEALELPAVSDLLGTLQAQPPWSEVPVLILTSGGESRLAVLLDLVAEAAGSVTLLERPMRAATLLRSVQVALRSRGRQYQLRDLLEAKARLAAIVESSDDAILSTDLDSIITTWNRGAERLYGYTVDEAVGQPVTILIPPDRLDEEVAFLAHIRQGKSVEQYETVRRCKSGRLLDVSLSISAITDVQGKILGASKIARDITARRQAEKALQRAQEELRQHAAGLEKAVAERTADLRATNEQLETFVYSVAHDLRSPLRSIIGYSQLLLDDYASGLEEMPQNLLRRIQASAEFMDKLLLDLLAYGRTARAEMELGPVEVRKAWDTALFHCATQIEQTQAQVEAAEPLPAVIAHEATLGQCLANLLSNALKFVAPGARPHVRFWADERGDKVCLSIQDNGLGIPAAQHERVFRVFERLNGGSYPGTGIGLSIVRKGVERMGGRVGLESTPGQGTRFWIELPKVN